MGRRAAAVGVLASALLVGLATAASAHALYRSSSPPNGSSQTQAPTKIVITFTERPDPKLSVIQVLDTAGRNHATGTVQPVPGQPFDLQTAVRSLSPGVYTVTWRTVSENDGHTTAGSFSFGSNVPTGTRITPSTTFKAPTTPAPAPLAVAGRWALYWGLALLFAAAIARFLVFRGDLPFVRPVLGGAWALAALGMGAMILSEKSSAGVGFSQLFSSVSGHHLVREGVAVGAAGVATLVACLRPRTWSFVLLGLLAGAAMYVHALNSHASAASPVWFNVGDQWLHLLSVAAWVGGLVWLLLGLRRRDGEERTTLALRFSWLAGITIAVVAASGIVRAVDEVGPPQHWSRLFTTSFGVTLDVKLALFVALVVFAARNRYVNVPGLGGGTRRVTSLRRSVAAEVAIAAGILGATGVLSSLAPPATGAQAAQAVPGPTRVVATGHDFATSVKVRLAITPGTVGQNRFVADVDDYDTGRPVDATGVTLNFSLPSRPDLGQPTLPLQRQGTVWVGTGTVLSMYGRWDVTMLVQEAAGGVSVPLSVRTRLPTEQIATSPGTGTQPTIYTIQLPGGDTVQGYLDRKAAGPNTAHFTFFTASGNELPIASAQGSIITPSGTVRPVKMLRLSKGHFVANVTLDAGHWTFLIDATPTSEGVGPFSAYYGQTIG